MKTVITPKLKTLMYICKNKPFAMNKVVLSIGTNTNTCFNLKEAINYLRSYFSNIQFTSTIESEPYGTIYKDWFLNTLAYFETDLSKDKIQLKLKEIEKKMGRKPAHKAEGKIIIDIDLIQWNNEILKPEDFERNYMHKLLKQMNDIAKS